MKKVLSVRIDGDLISSAKSKNVDLAKYIEACISNLLKENKCPTCGQKHKRIK